MEKMGANEIREKFLSFFESKEHLRLKSASLVPQNDKSLLLINSGMAPLKPYFTGQVTPPRKRATTSQKCIRTPDIEDVGKDDRHGTFFEMMGNFSFGDYFKKEAVSWAWEFCENVLELPMEKVWVTIYENDDEAYDLWHDMIGVPAEKIVRLGKDDNFWEIGLGPCGPCSEIYFDRGAEHGCGSPTCKPGCDCDRFMEFWNLVFTQFDKDENGNYNPLEHPNIDTGMGLERMACVMQGVDNLFEIDTMRYILDYICELAGVEYRVDPKKDTSVRIITDHVRGVTFMISDGILPSNEGRGYVLRRLLRRAARHGRMLGINGTFLSKAAEKVIDQNGAAYPELIEKRKHILTVIETEEKRFGETIDQGMQLLQELIDRDLIDDLSSGGKKLSGSHAFKLYDTYGFPLDLTKDVLEEHGHSVDEEGFHAKMKEQRDRARAARGNMEDEAWKEDIYSTLSDDVKTKFEGYDTLVVEDANVLAIVRNNEVVSKVQEGDHAVVILDRTPFYAVSGGQVADTGYLYNDSCRLHVKDVKKVGGNKYAHICTVTDGELSTNDVCSAEVEAERRMAIARNHSATHLLHKALRTVLGEHVEQAGSLVTPERLRFDFSHIKAMTPEELMQVEHMVNEAMLAAYDVKVQEMPIEEARKIGAMALFGEKYGDVVRVVQMGDFSVELCGGTHLKNTSQAGLFKIVSEGGIAAGVRRIEALTGMNVYQYMLEEDAKLEQIGALLKTSSGECCYRVEQIVAENRELSKELTTLKSKLAAGMAAERVNGAKEIGGIKYIVEHFENLDIEELRDVGDKFRDKMDKGLVVLTNIVDGKVTVITMATKSAIAEGIHAGNILKDMVKKLDGRGGGRPDTAQGGLKDVAKVKEVEHTVEEILKKMLS